MKKIFKNKVQNITYLLADIGLAGSVTIKTDYVSNISDNIKERYTIIPIPDILKLADIIRAEEKPEITKSKKRFRKFVGKLAENIKNMHNRITENDESIKQIHERIDRLELNDDRQDVLSKYERETIAPMKNLVEAIENARKDVAEIKVPTENGCYWHAGEIAKVVHVETGKPHFIEFDMPCYEPVTDDGKWGSRIK